MTTKQSNRLANENSPYLLQHAYNPVNWHPWDDVALNLAATENKLLIISIGYAACHWCHVMEDESFENEEVALAMNRDFISIKVDREERPDIDQVYMTAAYATTGRGGWPLNVIALPDRRPVFAGTYYSTQNWLQILHYFTELFHNRPEALLHHADEIANGMKKHHYLPVFTLEDQLSESVLHDLFSTWEDDLDFTRGGTHGAPKFPMPVNLFYLLTYGKRFRHKHILDYVELTLDQMSMGGIFDQIGGGFSRYSVDAEWNVPHFEKMLYDNAQLISLYSQAYTATGRQAYKEVVEKTVTFVERELTSPGGLFHASLDADSEGMEGAFYAWKQEEIIASTGSDPKLVAGYYSCTGPGNWENGLNVLRRSLSDGEFAVKHGLSTDDLTQIIQNANQRLFEARNNRIRPATDDKILTCWNALMISALTEAARAFDHPLWLEKAVTAAGYYRDRLKVRNDKLWRNSKAGGFAIAGFLDDYCFLIKAFLDIYQATFDQNWLEAADRLTQNVLRYFNAAGGLFFNLASEEEPRLISETVELTDNVIPASNSQMAINLFVLGHLLQNNNYLKRSEKMVKTMIPMIQRNPAFHANWAGLLVDYITGPREVTVTGDEKLLRLQEFAGYYLPGVIFKGTSNSTGGKTLITVCTGKTCHAPVETVQEAIKLLDFGLKNPLTIPNS